MPRLGLLIPEFPTQTHIAMWRLGQAMRRAGVEVDMLSTRRPGGEGAVHPALAEEARGTFYAWPSPVGRVLSEAVRSIVRWPAGAWYALSLRESGLAERCRVLAMIVPALALKRRARERGLGHVFVHSCASAAHMAALCRILGGPAYSLRLGGDIDVYGKDQRAKMRRATVVVGAARVNMHQAIDRGGVAKERAIWSWLGVETGKYRPRWLEQASDPTRQPAREAGSGARVHETGAAPAMRVVTVARLNHAKGHRFALAAIAGLVRDGLDVRYTIVGDGPEREAIRAQAAELGLGERVTLAGAMDEDGVRSALGEADVFVLPTSGPGEGSPVAVLEAMSAGLAIVATDVGGLREMVGEQEGLIVPPGDEAAMGEALRSLARDPARREAMGRSARARAEREFDVDAVAARLIGYFFPGWTPKGDGRTEEPRWDDAAIAAPGAAAGDVGGSRATGASVATAASAPQSARASQQQERSADAGRRSGTAMV